MKLRSGHRWSGDSSSMATSDEARVASSIEGENYANELRVNGMMPKPKINPISSGDGDGDKQQRQLSDRSILMITHFNVFLYALFFWIQNGIMPFLTKKLGVNTVMYGYLQTTFATVQLLGGPVFGRFGDIYGSKYALMLAFSSATMTYGILALANSVEVLFLSRIFSVFLHVMQGGLMIVTDLSDSSNRADSIAKLGVSYGLGFTVGPSIGGLIASHYSEQTAAFISFLGSLGSIVMIFFTFPTKTKQHDAPLSEAEAISNRSVFSMFEILSLLKKPGAPLLLMIKLITGLPAGIFQSMFAVVAMEKFQLTPATNGYIMSYVGIVGLIMQGFGVGFLNKRFGEQTMIKIGIFITMCAYLMLCYVENIWQLAIVLFPLVVGMTIKTVIISSSLTKTVSDADTGTMLGMNMAVNSLIRSFSPTVGGILISYYGWIVMGYFGFICCALTAVYLWLHRR
ncbi:solute carrier family 22 member 18-like [Lineus longissimus]|uniref:solute carrier family 22 member 18-like n=1 Tax=Lineus longissimus TaxID=88925 RepID=UPI002B4D9EED